MATGDRPNFPLTNQRLDKVDIEAISDLIAENTMRTIGAILGPCGGLLSDVVTTYDGLAGTLTIGACRLGYAHYAAGSSTAYDGGVVRWDPSYVAGGDTVDVSSFGTTAGDEGYIFFKRSEIEHDEDNRAYYDALAQEKKVGVANTRFREIAIFSIASTYDGLLRSEGWFPFLRLRWSVTGADPDIYKISAFDGFGGGAVNNQVARASDDVNGLGVSWTKGHIGVARLFREVIGSVQHAYDSDFTLNTDGGVANQVSDVAYRWAGYGLPRGLNQLNADLTTAESDIVTLQDDVSVLPDIAVWQNVYDNKQPVLHAILPIGLGDSGASYALTPTNQVYYAQPGVTPIPIPSWRRQTNGRLELTWTSPVFTENNLAVVATPNNPTSTEYKGIICSFRWNSSTQLYIYTWDTVTSTWDNAALSVSLFNIGQTTT